MSVATMRPISLGLVESLDRPLNGKLSNGGSNGKASAAHRSSPQQQQGAPPQPAPSKVTLDVRVAPPEAQAGTRSVADRYIGKSCIALRTLHGHARKSRGCAGTHAVQLHCAFLTLTCPAAGPSTIPQAGRSRFC